MKKIFLLILLLIIPVSFATIYNTDSNLVAYYVMNETSGNLTDYAKGLYPCFLQSGMPIYRNYSIGASEYTIYFSGNDNFRCGYLSDALYTSRQNMTIALFFSSADISTSRFVISNRNQNPNWEGFTVGTDTSCGGASKWNYVVMSNNVWSCVNDASYTANQHKCGVYMINGTGMYMWHNKSFISTTNSNAWGNTGHNYVDIGYNPTANNYEGNAGKIAFFNRTLTNDEINSFCDEGIIMGGEDATPPIITTNLSNNTKYDSNIDFYVSINENGNCNINNSNWNKNIISDTYFIFTDNSVENNKNYNIEIECEDLYENSKIEIYNITKGIPEINILFPINESNIKSNKFNVTFQFYNFNPNICLLYMNISNYTAVSNISENNYNVTIDDGYTYNLYGYYRGESVLGNKAFDFSHYGYNGTIYNVNLGASKNGNNTGSYAYNFNGINSVINLSDRDIYTFNDGDNDFPFTINAWIYLNNSGSGDVIMAKRGAVNKELTFQVTGGGGSNLQITLYDNNSNYIGRKYNTGLGNNEWMFVTVTYSGNKTNNGLKLYINANRVDNENVSSGVYTGMSNTDNAVTIGTTADLLGVFSGKIDELTLFNYTFNQSEITSMYHYGVLNESHIEEIQGTNLNESQNVTLIYNPYAEMKKDFNYFISCRNDYNINSTVNLVHFDSDFTPPVINMISPPDYYNETFNVNIWINFTLNEYANCEINLSDWSLNYTDYYNYLFKDNNAENGFYVLNVSCVDLSDNYDNVLIYFTKDVFYPIINIYNPNENNNSQFNIQNEDFLMNFTVTENNDLYLVTANITRIPTDTIYYYFYSNVSGTFYQYYSYINITDYPIGNYKTCIFACDSHTANLFPVTPDITNKPNQIDINIEEKNINIKSNDNESIKTNTVQLNDKISFGFEYDKPKKILNFEIDAKNTDYIPYKRSGYKGHFVIDKTYYMDYENSNVDYVDIDVKDDKYLITVYLLKETNNIMFNSIGILNCDTKCVLFSIYDSEETELNIIDSLTFTNTILFYALFISVQLILMFIGLKFNMKWVIILSNVMAIMISVSFLRFVELNKLFQNSILIYIFINIIIIFLVSNMKIDGE